MPTVTSPVVLDETLQSTNSVLQTQNGKMDSIITKLQGIIDALGLDPTVYKPAGSKTCAELISSLLVRANLGNVYDITDNGTTTSDFVEGAGKSIHLGDNVVIVDIGTGGTSIYKFDLLAGMVDLSNYVEKEAGKGLSTNDYTTDEKNKLAGISANANKVESSSTNGNIKIDSTETQVYDDSDLQNKTSILTATAQGNPISFNTLSAQNAESTEVSIEPIQDLHGYSKPWVGGAGKNKLPLTVTGIKEVNTDGTWSGNTYSLNNVTFTILTDNANNVIGINANANNASAVTSLYLGKNIALADGTYILNGTPSGGGDSNYEIVADGKSVDTGSGTRITISGDTFNLRARIASGLTMSNIVFYPMIRLSTETDASFEPYENFCPISGTDEIKILGCGKNIFEDVLTGYSVNSLGKVTSSEDYNLYIARVGANKSYVISNDGTALNSTFGFFYDKPVVGAFTYDEARHGLASQFTSPIDGYVGVAILDSNTKAQLEESNQPSTYEAYHLSNNILLEVGQDVYGGKFIPETGVFTVTDGYIASYNGETLPSTWISSMDEYSIGTTPTTGAEVAYKLATSTTIQLTPNQIALLQGANYLSTNCQSLKLTYRTGQMATLGDVKDAIEDLGKPPIRVMEEEIVSYTSANNKYVFTHDGYVTAIVPTGSGYVRVVIYDGNDKTLGRYTKYAHSDGDEEFTIFVKKGMKARIIVSDLSDVSVIFRAMVPSGLIL